MNAILDPDRIATWGVEQGARLQPLQQIGQRFPDRRSRRELGTEA